MPCLILLSRSVFEPLKSVGVVNSVPSYYCTHKYLSLILQRAIDMISENILFSTEHDSLFQ